MGTPSYSEAVIHLTQNGRQAISVERNTWKENLKDVIERVPNYKW